jgi:hypothetical protein
MKQHFPEEQRPTPRLLGNFTTVATLHTLPLPHTLSCKSAVNEKIFRAKMRKVISGVIL